MNEFNVGDKVYLEGKISEYDASDNTYCVGYSDYRELPHTTCWVKDDVLHTADELYNKGLNDAWELAKKIVKSPNKGGYKANELAEIFGISDKPVLDAYTPQEALAKVKEYKERDGIKVGDVVKLRNYYIESIVTRVSGDIIYRLFSDGSCDSIGKKEDLVRTGKHFDSIDEFMRSEE